MHCCSRAVESWLQQSGERSIKQLTAAKEIVDVKVSAAATVRIDEEAAAERAAVCIVTQK